MKRTILTHSYSDNQKYHQDVHLASSCPICGITLVPETLYAALLEPTDDEPVNKLFVLNYCTNCDECFVSRHIYDEGACVYMFESFSQNNFTRINFSNNIQTLSPQFVSVFNESAHAESLGLSSICGMGYRKALEFLVKDYVISLHSGDTKKISSMPLAQCIDQYIENPRLKSLAKASAWLGNDETHYIKKHANHGIPELKTYITAFITYVDAELAVLDAEKLLSS